MVVIGVDPGLHGGLACCRGRAVLSARRLPLLKRPGKPCPDLPRLVAWVGEAVLIHGATVAVVEDVGARPGQGVTSMFRFGLVTGMVRGVLAASGVRILLVRPASWKAALGLTANKESCREAATWYFGSPEFWPRVGDDGVAEAALMTRMVDR